MKKRIALLLLMLPLLASAQEKRIEFQEYDLDNGLHVILHQDTSLPIVAVNIMYHVGSKNEDPDRTGFAHFFEHLMFEGSENIGRGEFFEYVQNAGGNLNAFTTFDKTTYYEVLPSNQLKLALWLESERLLHLKIDSIGIETQRKVVKEERKQRYENQPYGSWMAEMFELAYTKHPYRWVPIGEVQYIDQAKYEEFMDFYKHYYVPGNAALAICGDIDYEETKELVDQYFGNIPAGNQHINRPNPDEPAQTEEKRDTVYDNIQLPALFMGYHVPEQGHDDYYPLLMLQKLLSDGQSSRLYKKLVDEEQLCAQIGTYPAIFEDAGLFISYAIANMGKSLTDIETQINAQIDKLQTEGIPDREFEKIKNIVETQFVTQNAQLNSLSISLCDYYLFFENTNLINTEINRYESVTKDDIIRVANKYLVPENRIVLKYLPKSQDQALITE
ncbi:MAG: insulinase family protein [Bacteroidetes bacterium]|jgi:predicted Zn-dependent peptidase|nr:insulinase family protein [Bacteroidota bacterium]